MKIFALAALGAVAISMAMPAMAQDVPFKDGDYWAVSRIKVDDGHASDYSDYLAGNWRKQVDWQVSKGYIKGYKVLDNSFPREGEPDVLLILIYDHMPTNAEKEARNAAFNAYMATTDRAMDASSGERAKYRHRLGTALYQEQLWKK